MLSSVRLLSQACAGAAALEFAIVSIPFFGLLLGTMSVALNFYLQFALDYSLQQAVRQVQLGQLSPTMSVANFTGSVFCPIFVSFAPCSGVLLSIQPVADYTATSVTQPNAPSAFCIGAPGQLMYARATYRAPVLDSIYNLGQTAGPGSNASTIVSAAAFANENPSGAAVAGNSGC